MRLLRSSAGDADGTTDPVEQPGLSAGGRSQLRIGLTYSLLVIAPVVMIVALLSLAGPRHPARPASTPVALDVYPRVLVAVVVILGACMLVGGLFRWIGQPAVVGEIVTGILLGPSVLGAAWPAGFQSLFPAAVLPQLNVLAQLGVILFVFVAGLRMDTRLLRGRGDVAVVVGHVSIALPFLLGVLLALLAYRRFAPGGVGIVPFALFLGTSMSITALPVLARILIDRGMYRTEVGTVALTSALVDDATAWCVLATVVALTQSGTLVGVLVTIGLTGAFVLLMVVVVRPGLRLAGRGPVTSRLEVLRPLVLLALLLSALTTDLIGVHSIFGAFVFGLVCPRDQPVFRVIRDRVSGLTTTLLLPLFFAYSGLRTDIRLLGLDARLWLWCGFILLVAVAGKLAGSAVAARAVGVGWPQSLQLGALMNARGLTELIVLNVGLDLGVLNRTLFTMLVIMAVVSTAMTAPILTILQRRIRRTAPPLGEVGERIAAPAPAADPLVDRLRQMKEAEEKTEATLADVLFDLRTLHARLDVLDRSPAPPTPNPSRGSDPPA